MNISEYKKQKWVKREEPILIKKVDLQRGITAWLVIDSIGNGIAAGGIRLGEKVDLDEVKLLANEMTLKRLFYNQSVGGAKAGIYCPYPFKNNERKEIFINLGNALKPLLSHKFYNPGTDMGTNQKDIDNLFEGAGIKRPYDNDPIDSSYYTAVTAFSVLKAICGFNNFEFKKARLGIQGLGKVGLNLLRIAYDLGIKLVATSTQHGALYALEGLDVNRIFDLAKKHGDEFVNYYSSDHKIELSEFFEKDMDIMCPCAGIYPINEGNIDKVQAKIIVPGCNVAATEKIENQLYERGITYLPGFVCNAGGVLGYSLKIFGIGKNERSTFLDRGIQNKVSYLLRQSAKSKISPSEMARSIVRQNQEKFAIESRAGMKGKAYLAVARLKYSGTTDLLGIITWKLIQRKLIAPNYLRKHLAKKIVFDRLFKN